MRPSIRKLDRRLGPGNTLHTLLRRRDFTVVFLGTGTALRGGFFGTGGSLAPFVAFTLNTSNNSCLPSACVPAFPNNFS
jgi:hypothetical protein